MGLTTPDLVVLSFLSHEPMHGYALWQELLRCEVEDWAPVSRAQVYYSLAKLEDGGWIADAADRDAPSGPERRRFRATANGRRALARELGRKSWVTTRVPPPFTTWLALSDGAGREARLELLGERVRFLEGQIAKERATLEGIRGALGDADSITSLQVERVIEEFEGEVAWLERVRRVAAQT